MKKPVLRTYIRNTLEILFEVIAIRFLWRAIIVGTLAFAIPEGANVIEGTATVTNPTSQSVQINQTSDKAIIDWNSFNIGAQEKTQFVQPSSSSVALNRINPQQGASQIYGMLSANGRIILINQAGIYFGPGAHVDVAGIIASTSNMKNANFLSGNYIFDEPSPFGGSVINEGTIIARNNGLVALLGTGVSNKGVIQARLGTVVLASGNKFTIDFYGDQMINFAIDEPASRAGVDQNGSPLQNGVSNEGKILANGGVVLVTARAAQGVLNNVINMDGIVEAHSISQHNGVIILSGGEAGTVKVTGRLSVSGRGNNKGGTIKIFGDRILVAGRSALNANGMLGGGEILIGGNAHGAGPEQNATSVLVTPNVKITANAILRGDGGQVVVWSNEATQFYGRIFAEGGRLGGNGGWVETSSKNYLDVNGALINTLAEVGKTGTWLLDPTNIFIALNQANATAAGMTGTDTSANTGSGTNPITFQPSGAILDSLLTTGNLTTALGTSNVVVTTTNASGTGIGNITVVDPIIWATTNSLTLTAANNIAINAAISDTAAGSLILNATGNVTQTAAIGGLLSVTKQGAGTATFNQTNTYTGITTIAAGTLSVPTITSQGSTGPLGTNTVLINGGTLSYTGGTTGNINRNIAVGSSGGILQATTSGTTLILTGTINPAGAGGGANPLTIDVNAGNITLNPGATTTALSDLTVTGSGTGTLLLSKAGIFTGNTTVNSGELNNGLNAALPSTTILTVNGGIYDLNNFTQTVAGVSSTLTGGIITNSGGGGGKLLTISNAINGSSNSYAGTLTGNLLLTLNLTGTGSPTQTLTSANSSYRGATTITSGTLSIAHIANSGSNSSIGTGSTTPAISIAGAGTLQYSGSGGESTNRSITITSTGADLDVSGTTSSSSTATFAGVTGNNMGLNLIGSGYGVIGGIIATTGGTITKSGTGTWYLSGLNTYTGTTTISAGTLRANTLLSVSGGASSFGAPTSAANGTIALGSTGVLQYTGALTTSNRVINLTGSGGTIDASGSGALTLSGGVTGSGFGLVLTGTGAGTESGIIGTTTGTLTKNGTNTWTLSGANTFSGGTTITNGTVVASVAQALGTSGTIAITPNAASTAILDLTALSTFSNTSGINFTSSALSSAAQLNTSATISLANAIGLTGTSNTVSVAGNTTTLSGALTGTGGLIKSGAGILALSKGSSGNTYSGATTINAGTFEQITNANSLPLNSDVTIANVLGANLTLNNLSGQIGSLSGTGTAATSGNLVLGSGTLTVGNSNSTSYSGVITSTGGGITKIGNSTLTLSGANTYTGATLVSVGTLQIGATTALGNTTSTTVSNNAALDISFSSGTLGNTNTINLNGSGVSGAGALTMTGNSDVLNNPITLQTSSTIGGTGTGILTLGGAITGTSTNLTINLANAGVSLPTTTLTTSGNLSVTTSGAITQTGVLTIPGTSSFSAGANAITLTQNNAFTGAVSLTNSGANNVALTNNIALNLGTSSIGSGTLGIIANGSISQTGAITQSGAGAITLTENAASSDILLGTQANNFLGTITFGGTLGNIRDLSIRNIYASATLPTNIGSLTNLRNLTLQFDNTGIAFPAITLHSGGNLIATAGGAITETGVLTVPGTSTFTAGANVITLTQNNAFTGAVSLTNSGANNVAVTNSLALNLGASNVGSGTLNLTGVGISQSGAMIQAASAGAVTVNAGAGVINLANSSNTFTGTVSLNNSGANAVQLTNSSSLILGASSVGTGTLGITAGGTISETGAIVQAANAGTVTLSVTTPNSDILLATQPNDFSGAVVYGGTLSNIRDIGRRNINVGAGVTTTNLDLLTNLRNATLIFDNANAIAPSFTLHNGGNLYVDTSGSLSSGTGGSISQIGAVTVPGTVTLIAGSHPITVTQNNSIGGDIFITNSGSNNVAITTIGTLNIGMSSVGSGTLTLTGVGVTQSGAITQAASAGAATINAGAGAINLSNASNSFTGAVSLNNSGANNVALTNNGALTIGTSSIGTGTFSLITGGALSEAGAVTQSASAGAISLASTAAATNIDLSTFANDLNGAISFAGTLANIQDFKLRNINSTATLPTNLASLVNLRNLTLTFNNTGISFPALTLHSGGNLIATAGGTITETGALTIPGTSSFNSGSHPITLTQNNNFTGAVTFTNSGGGDISVTTSGALILNTSNVGSGGFIANSVGVSQIGIFTQASGAGTATFNAGAGPISLTQNNVFTGSIALNNTGANNAALTNSGAVVIAGANVGSGTLDITAGGTISQTGAIIQEANAGITTYSFTAPNSDLLLASQPNNTNGFINIGGTLSNLRDVELRNIGTANQAVVNLQLLTSLRNLTVILDNVGVSLPALTLHSGGNLVINTSGSLSGGLGGDISQTGILVVPGTTSLTAGSHAITMTQNNVFTGDVTLSNSGANNVALTNSIALSLGTSSVGTGTLNLTSVGISQTGSLIIADNASAVIINAGAGTINLTNSSNDINGPISLFNSGANNVAINSVDELILGTSSVGTGTLTFTASGPVTETGAITQATGAGAASFSAGANPISLTQANIFTGPVIFSNSGANNVALTNNAALNLGASTIGSGTFGITAAGPITQSGIITQASNAGATSFSAGANPITLTLNNIFTGAVSLTNSGANNVALTNNRALILGTSSVGTGTLDIIAAGALTQTGTLTQTSGAGAVTMNVGANPITLTASNSLTGAVSVTNSGNNNVALTNTGLLTLGTFSVGSGTLNLTGVGVTQTGAITQAAAAGTATINAGAGSINLANSSNIFTGSVSLFNSGANNVALTNNAALALNTSSVGTGTLNISANGTLSEVGAITQAATAGAITLTQNALNADILLNTQPNNLSGTITYGGTLSNIRDVGLRNINANATLPTNVASLSNLRNLTDIFDNSAIALPAITISGNLTITAGGAITQTGILTVPGTPTFTVTTPGVDILLASAANNFGTTPIITDNGNIRNLALRNVAVTAAVPTLPANLNDLTLIFNNAGMTLPALTLSGNLTATANGAITQSGTLNVNNTGAVTTLSAGSGNNITLTDVNNLFETVTITSANNVNVTDASALNFGASTISGNLIANVTAPITQSGVLTVTGSTSLAAGVLNDITLNSNNDFSTLAVTSADDVILKDINGLDLGASTISGDLTVNTTGDITQSGAINISGVNKTTTFSPNSGNVTLTNANNNFTNLMITNATDVNIKDSNAINLAASTILGNFTLNTSGAITQIGGITANGVGKVTTLSSGSTNNITLDTDLNDFTAIAIPSAQSVILKALNDLTLNAISSQSFTVTAGGNLTTSGLIQTAGGNVHLTTTGAGIITVGASGIQTSTDQVSPGGSITIIAANTSSLPSAVYLNGQLNTQGGTGGAITIGGGVVQNVPPVAGAGNINVTGNSSAFILNDNTYTTATTYNIIAQDIIINGLQQSTGVGSDLTFFADSNNAGVGGVRVNATGGIISSGNLTIKGSDLIINPGIAIEILPGSVIQAAGTISLLGNVGNSIVDIDRNIQATGGAITITPAGIGHIELEGNLTTSGGNINLNSLTRLLGNVTLTTNGGTISANAIVGIGKNLTVDVGSGTNVALTNASNEFGTFAVTSGNNVQLSEVNNIDLGTSVISGNFDVTAGGNITNSGTLQVAGTSTLSASTGEITLTQAGNNFNRVAIPSATEVSIVDTNAIDLGPISISGNLNVTANGAITQNGGALTINGINKIATFAAGTANDITLNNAANDFSTITINLTSANNVSLRDVNKLNLGTVTVAGNLEITTNGALTQTGALTMTGSNKTLTLAVGSANDILLHNSLNSFVNAVINNANNVTLTDTSALNFGTSTISGNLEVSTTGAITQTGVLTVPGTSSFNAGTNSITLTQNNNFTGAVLLTNSTNPLLMGTTDVAVTNSGLLIIGPTTSSLDNGTLTLTGLGVTQTGAITQAANAGTVTINAGAGVINLANSGNIFTGAVSLNNTGVNNVSLLNNTALTLGASSVGSGTLGIAANGSISQSGAITQAGAGAITLTQNSAASDILLGTQSNNLLGTISFGGTLSNIRDFSLRNINASATLPTNIASVSNLRNLTLQFDTTGITFPAITLTSGGNLSVTAGGTIAETGAITVPGTSSFNAGTNAITLTQSNAFTGDVTLTNSGSNTVSVTNSGALSLGASSVGSGALTLTGVGVSQNGAITQQAGASAVTINAGAGAIGLASNNTFTGAVSLNNTGANNVQLTNSGALVLGASNIGSGAVEFTLGGSLSQTGPLIQAANAGTMTFIYTAPSSDTLLASQPNDINSATAFGGNLSNFRDVAIRTINANPSAPITSAALLTNLRNLTFIFDNAGFFLNTITLHSSGNLALTTGGSIIQVGGVLTVPGTSSFNAGAHAISLTGNNEFTGAVTLTNSGSNNVSLTNSIPLNIAASSVGSGTLTLTGVGVTQSGAITQAAGAGTATINADTGAIDLSNANNSFTGAVSLNNSGNNNVALTNNGALTIGASNVGTGTLTLITGGNLSETGAIVQPDFAGAISFASTAAGTNIDLSTAANNFEGAISFSGTLTNIQDFKLRNIDSIAALPTNLASLTNLRNLTLQFDTTGISFPALTLHSGGNLVAIAGGAITETGALTIPGTSSFNSGSHPITLTQANNFTGAVAFTNTGANDITVTNNGALVLDTSSVGTGAFTANSVGVSQIGILTQASGAGIATFNSGAGPISLTQNNVFTGSVALNNTGANNVALTNTGALNLAGVNAGSGTLDITAGGSITESAPIIQEANAGITTYSFTAPNSDLLLASQPNNTNGFINIGGTLSNLRDVEVRNIGTANQAVVNLQLLTSLRNLTVILDNVGVSLPALTLHSGGNLVLDSSGSLSGGLGGAITQTGVLTVPGTSSFTAGSHTITLTQNNAFTGAVTLSNTGANNVAITNSIPLSIATSSVGSGALTLTGLGVSQTGGIIETANAGLVTINAGAGPINLTNTNNELTGAISLNNTGANNVALTNAGTLTIATSSIGTGTLALTAGGNITETGGITQASGAGGIIITENIDASNIIFDQANNLNGAITFSGTLSNIHNLSLRNTNATATLPTNITSLTDISTLTLQFDTAGITFPALTLHSGGNLIATAGGAITETGALTVPGTSSFNAGANPITLTQSNSLTGAVTLSNTGANNVSLATSGALDLATSTIGNNLTAVAGSDITLSGTITAGNSIVLAGTGFINNAGASALNPGAGDFQVWSANPASDTRGGIVYNFKQYNATYGVTPVQGTGNGFLYTVAPFITPELTGAVSKSYTGTTDATLTQSNYIASGSIDGDTVTFNPLTGTYASVNVGNNINVAVSGINIAGATNGSATVYGYQLASTTANANIGEITQASLTITANDLSKTYGQTTTFTGTEFTPTGLQNGETVGSATLASAGASPTANVESSPYSITVSAATGGTFNPANYNINYVSGSLTIDPATLVYNANLASRTYGAANPSLSGTVTGFVNGETQATATTGTLAFATPAGATSNVGNYAINGEGLTANFGNYTFTQAPGNATALSITQAPLTVTANNASKTYGQTVTFAGTEFTASGLQNGETVGNVALASAGAAPTATVASSPYSITASSATGGTFNAANYSINYTNGSLTIDPATLTYNANLASRTVNVANPPLSGTVTGFVNSETQASATTGTLAFTTPADINSSVGKYAINGSGLIANYGNYVFVQAPGNATAFTITPASTTTPVNKPLVVQVMNQTPDAPAPGASTEPSSASITIIEPTTTPGAVTIAQSKPTVPAETHAMINAATNEIIRETLTELQPGVIVPEIGVPPSTGGLNYLFTQTPSVPSGLGIIPILGGTTKNVENIASSQTPTSLPSNNILPHMKYVPLTENGIRHSLMPSKISQQMNTTTQSSALNNLSMVLALASIGLLGAAVALGTAAVLVHMSLSSTVSLANKLSKANTENYMKNGMQVGESVSITNGSDVAKLLPNGLPEGYKIVAIPVQKDVNVVCILIGPMSTHAMFTATGVSAHVKPMKTTAVS